MGDPQESPELHGMAGPYEKDSGDGGEPACWAHLVCPSCGQVEGEGHSPGCPEAACRDATQRAGEPAGRQAGAEGDDHGRE
jgi:hypothetical protein